MGRNAACHCGSGSKYKRCCHDQDEIIRRQLRSTALPAWILSSRGKLHQFEKYACKVFDLPARLASMTDSRRAAEIPTFDVVNSLFHTALLRIPSLNALEGDLKETDFQRLIGRPIKRNVKRKHFNVGKSCGLFSAFSPDDLLPSRF
jgi:SEC-C motif